MALLGGTGRLWGPIVGVIPFALLQEYINANYSSYSTLVMGIAFLVIVYFLPKGVVGRINCWQGGALDMVATVLSVANATSVLAVLSRSATCPSRSIRTR